MPFPGQTIYRATKAAPKLFTEGLYAELLNTNVKMNVFFLGAMSTNIAANPGIEVSSQEEETMKIKTISPKIAARQLSMNRKKTVFASWLALMLILWTKFIA